MIKNNEKFDELTLSSAWNTGQENNIAQPKISSSLFSSFNHLTVVYVLFCNLTKGITLKICRLCVCVLINKHSFKPFMCLDLVLEC